MPNEAFLHWRTKGGKKTWNVHEQPVKRDGKSDAGKIWRVQKSLVTSETPERECLVRRCR